MPDLASRPLTALVRAVSPRLPEGALTFLDRRPVDVGRAEQQHAGYVQMLTALGCTVRALPALPDAPDGVFVEDVAVVLEDLAILTRPGIESRRQEVDSAHQALQALGLRTTRIQPPGTLDGGDVLQSGDDVLIGHSRRTNEAGIEQLRALVEPLGRRVTVCTVTGCLHLKTGVTALPDGSLLATPGWVDLTGVRRPVHIAPESAGSDVLLVGEGIVLSAAAPATADLLARLGFDTHPVDLTEFEAVEAGPTCLSILIPPSAGSTGR